MPDTNDINLAISAALSCDWHKACLLNKKLLTQNPRDVDCLNRLGKAYLELGDKKQAIAIFQKVLRLSRYDPIAQKNLARAMISKAGNKTAPSPIISKPQRNNFLEEPGKTKLVNLVNVAPTTSLLKLDYGDKIKLAPRRHTVAVCDENNNYVGALPDDLGHRLSLLIKGGNTYDGLIKSASKNTVVVFLRELTRAKRFANTPSFSASGTDYFTFVREETTPEHEPAKPEADEESDDESPASHLHDDEETEGE
ncbi:MAG: tetratricopeptide repeat protein [Patescibacteria group bacterium]|nr:tetratricopeptide repeat protein [Patescibacteria group bacterium]MCL5432122.1 tetratricopeptide repeat protein [Patescibacteria group bacterium]